MFFTSVLTLHSSWYLSGFQVKFWLSEHLPPLSRHCIYWSGIVFRFVCCSDFHKFSFVASVADCIIAPSWAVHLTFVLSFTESALCESACSLFL